jgi:hypothetical protein
MRGSVPKYAWKRTQVCVGNTKGVGFRRTQVCVGNPKKYVQISDVPVKRSDDQKLEIPKNEG